MTRPPDDKIDAVSQDHSPRKPLSNVLPYQKTRGTSPSTQALLGFGAWVTGVAVALAGMAFITINLGVGQSRLVWCIPIATFAGVLVLAVYVHVRFHWRYFATGLILGLGITCLLPVGIIMALCHRRL